MQELVEIDLRRIIHKNTNEMTLKEEEEIDMVGMSMEEIMELDLEKKMTPELRVFDERLYDQLVFDLYKYIKFGPKRVPEK